MKYLIPVFVFLFMILPLAAIAQICTIYTGVPSTDIGPMTQRLLDILDRVAYFLLVLGTAGGILVVIVGGIKYMLAGGDESKVGDAKKLITYGILGFIIVIAAQFIICWVGEVFASLYAY